MGGVGLYRQIKQVLPEKVVHFSQQARWTTGRQAQSNGGRKRPRAGNKQIRQSLFVMVFLCLPLSNFIKRHFVDVINGVGVDVSREAVDETRIRIVTD